MAATAAVASAVIAAGSLAYSVSEGEKAQGARKKALSKQEQAQKNAQASASADVANAERESKMAARKSPDLGSMLTDAQVLASQGIGATNPTGAAGVDPQRLKLARTTLLGG